MIADKSSVSCVYELMCQGFCMVLHLGTEFIIPAVLHTVLHLGCSYVDLHIGIFSYVNASLYALSVSLTCGARFFRVWV